ncbi:hypothetical protein C8Q70DRAFT_627640 [Cubamyces menziesii]|nr:hypothetical protein C8Q70DRAFT_627640 [Cubamyces menziesii]
MKQMASRRICQDRDAAISDSEDVARREDCPPNDIGSQSASPMDTQAYKPSMPARIQYSDQLCLVHRARLRGHYHVP